jgi:hypothetical protein
MIRKMTKKPANFEVTCPCCSALLKVDVETRAVIAHTAAVKPRMFNDMEDAARAMKEQDTRRESIFRTSGEEVSGSSEEGQGNARHRQADTRLRFGLAHG